MASQRSKKGEASQSKSSSQAPHGKAGSRRHNGSHRDPDRGSSRGGHGRTSGRGRRHSQPGPGRAARQTEHQEPQTGLMGRATSGVRDAGAKTVDTVKQHPMASALIGAGLAAGASVLAWRALRGSSAEQGVWGEGEPQEEGEQEAPGAQGGYQEAEEEQEEGQEPEEPEASAEQQEDEGEGEEESDSGSSGSSRTSGSRMGDAYQYGKEKLGNLWENHPLMTGAGILALGVAAGMLLPATRAEKKTLGRASGLTEKIRSAGRELLDQGKQVASRVVTETGQAIREEVEKEGLTPDKLARKVKRIAGRVKDVISDATE